MKACTEKNQIHHRRKRIFPHFTIALCQNETTKYQIKSKHMNVAYRKNWNRTRNERPRMKFLVVVKKLISTHLYAERFGQPLSQFIVGSIVLDHGEFEIKRFVPDQFADLVL